MPLITRDEADAILSNGYPTDTELDRFPLGEFLKRIPDINSRYRAHISGVMEGVNILLDDKKCHEIIGQWRGTVNPVVQEKFTQATISIFNGRGSQEAIFHQIPEKEFEPFFRLMAMYHDIGKCVIHERHPMVGWHLIKDVYRNEVENKLYPLLLGIPYNRWARQKDALMPYQKRLLTIFEANIKFHDLFGVLSTGEAALPVMVDLIPLKGMDTITAKELFSILFLFNLGDLYGSVPEILPEKMNYFCDDWECLCKAIEDADGDRDIFFKLLYEEAKTPTRTLERIKRFMNEGESEERRNIIEERLLGIFEGETPTGRRTFYANFAYFCKLDYALAFKKKIMEKACDACRGDEVKGVTGAMGKIIWLLVQLEREYGGLQGRNDVSPRRLGLQLAGLTRTPDIGNTICDLLLKTEEKGKEWTLSECTVWFMDE